MSEKYSFFNFLSYKDLQNEGIIRNSGIIGGRALLEVLRYATSLLIIYPNHWQNHNFGQIYKKTRNYQFSENFR